MPSKCLFIKMNLPGRTKIQAQAPVLLPSKVLSDLTSQMLSLQYLQEAKGCHCLSFSVLRGEKHRA